MRILIVLFAACAAVAQNAEEATCEIWDLAVASNRAFLLRVPMEVR